MCPLITADLIQDYESLFSMPQSYMPKMSEGL